MQKRGIPSAVLVTERFVNLAQGVARSRGMPTIPMVVLPHNIEHLPKDQLHALTERALGELLEKLAPAAVKAQAAPA